MKRLLALAAMMLLSCTCAFGSGKMLPPLAVDNLEDMLFRNVEFLGEVKLPRPELIQTTNLDNLSFRYFGGGMALSSDAVGIVVDSCSVRRPFRISALGVSVFSVFNIGAKEEMVRTDARSVIACVANAVSVRVFSGREEIGKPVSVDRFTYPENSVSVPRLLPLPSPTPLYGVRKEAMESNNIFAPNGRKRL